MFESSKLNALLQPPAGWDTTDALFLTYSLNPKVLVSVLTDCGLRMTYANDPEKMKKHFLCLMQNDRFADDDDKLPPLFAWLLTCDRIRPVKRENSSSFHPKLIALVYQNNDDDTQKKLRLIISSKNLTKSTYLEGAVSIEGIVGGNPQSQNESLAAMIETVSESDPFAKNIAELIRNTDFTKDIQNIIKDKNAEYKLLTVGGGSKLALPQNPQKLRIVSPFLGDWNFLSGVIGNCNCWKVYTRREVPQGLANVPDFDKHFFCLPDSGNENSPELHAKIYALTENGTHHLYIGSANCSANGFGVNRELMLHITSNTCDFVDALDAAPNRFTETPKPYDPTEDTLPEGKELPEVPEAEETLLAQVKEETEQELIVHFFCEILECSVDRETYLETAASVIVGMDKEDLKGRVRNYKYRCSGRIPETIRCYIAELLQEKGDKKE